MGKPRRSKESLGQTEFPLRWRVDRAGFSGCPVPECAVWEGDLAQGFIKSLIFGGDFEGWVEGGDGLKPLGDKKRRGVGKEDRRKI